MRVVAREFGQPAVAEIVLFGRALAVVRLEQADDVLGRVVPEAGGLRVFLQVAGEVVHLAAGVGHGQVTRQRVVEGRDVGRSLDGGVPAQGHDAAAGPAHVAQQRLQDGGGADDLHALGLVRPADRVAEARWCAPGPEFLVSASATLWKSSGGMPQTCDTISGV